MSVRIMDGEGAPAARVTHINDTAWHGPLTETEHDFTGLVVEISTHVPWVDDDRTVDLNGPVLIFPSKAAALVWVSDIQRALSRA